MTKRAISTSLKPRFAIALALTTLTTGFLTAACQNASNTDGGTASNPAGGGGGTEASGNTVKIASSLPMTGSSLGQAQTIVNAIKQAIEENKNAACDGKLKIAYEPYDDATAAAGKWDPAQGTPNATKDAAAPTV